ncbi:GTP-binding protein [Sporosarcina sp. P37]|uniref:Era-like GTP-binding protein n=1 Tax=unclassified Sporosarcina TaxID=2647733 RepID=UPI0009C25486|nr:MULTISPECIES: GTPase [unclassified Sporosarcina]ARD47356.1 GTP-binding protein [Sporosarcina sp. P33]ARK23923.1 GTP-binding protein [Sporosarcina sp. P37]PID17707.1 GTP-binding protein [Sporosarcina sp. P35]
MKTPNFMSDESFDEIFKQESDLINDQLKKEILIAMIGDVNAGKSSTLNRLMQKDVAEVGAQPGETTEVKKFYYRENILFVDTPGLDDINQEHSQETLKFYHQADVILFFLNAAGTVLSDTELKSLNKIATLNKKIILVLNKIDAADDVPSLVNYILEHTGFAYPVIPISSKTGEQMEFLQKEILQQLKMANKDLLLAANMADKSSVAKRWILAAGASAAAIGAAPIPGADFVPLTTLQVGLMLKLSALYGKPITKDHAKELIIATIVGNIGKTAFRQIVKVIPGAGMIAAASVAGSMTVALGYAVKYMYENDMELTPDTLKKVYKTFLKKQK